MEKTERTFARPFCALLVAGLLFLFAGAASAHVALDDPNGGELLVAGSEHTIVWHVLIAHDTEDWDLWYSTTGVLGPWIEIAMDLPAGDISGGSFHSFVWTVPDVSSSEVRVRVRQDNSGSDYEDISDHDGTIASWVFVDGFETGDTFAWSATVTASK